MDRFLPSIAIVEDDRIGARRLAEFLSDQGLPVEVFHDGESFLERFRQAAFDLVITDFKLPGVDGLQVLREVKRQNAQTEVLVITGHGSIESAIEAIREGAFHYLTKPIRLEEFGNLIKRVVEKITMLKEARILRESLLKGAGIQAMIGSSPQMASVFRLVEKVAPLDCPVIIQGESGTGKELVAQAIHRLSPRGERIMVSFNCGGFSQELIPNELFGHEKGAFTGAYDTKVGLLETANNSTVFLDEIAEMPTDMQVKLLRVLQERQLYRIGGTRPVSLDIRLLAASNKDIEKEVGQGRLREDLYFRLNVVTIHLPRLVEREGDLGLLMDYFLHQYRKSYGREGLSFSPRAREILEGYSYPGNVRELEHIVARAVAISEGDQIQEEDLPPALREGVPADVGQLKTLEELEGEYIRHVLARVNNRRSEAACILGITRTTLWRKMNKYGLAE
jgi:two-component system response regulator AtoC